MYNGPYIIVGGFVQNIRITYNNIYRWKNKRVMIYTVSMNTSFNTHM